MEAILLLIIVLGAVAWSKRHDMTRDLHDWRIERHDYDVHYAELMRRRRRK